MEYILSIILTFIFVMGIIYIIRQRGKLPANSILLSQSEMHNLTKGFMPQKEVIKPTSQLQIRKDQNLIKVLAMEGKAYWIADNIFYSADLIHDAPDFTNAVPVDTINMSKEDIEKMMFVIDHLKRGAANDSRSSGN